MWELTATVQRPSTLKGNPVQRHSRAAGFLATKTRFNTSLHYTFAFGFRFDERVGRSGLSGQSNCSGRVIA